MKTQDPGKTNGPRPSTPLFRFPFHPRKLGMAPFFLSFRDARQEDRYIEQYLERSMPYIRFAGIVGTLLWMVFGLTDPLWVDRSVLAKVWTIRYGMILPFLLTMILASLLRRLHRWVPALFTLGLFSVAIGIMLINLYNPKPDVSPLKSVTF